MKHCVVWHRLVRVLKCLTRRGNGHSTISLLGVQKTSIGVTRYPNLEFIVVQNLPSPRRVVGKLPAEQALSGVLAHAPRACRGQSHANSASGEGIPTQALVGIKNYHPEGAPGTASSCLCRVFVLLCCWNHFDNVSSHGFGGRVPSNHLTGGGASRSGMPWTFFLFVSAIRIETNSYLTNSK